MSDDLVIGAGAERNLAFGPTVGGVSARASAGNSVNPETAASAQASTERNFEIRQEQQAQAELTQQLNSARPQSLLDASSAPATLQSIGVGGVDTSPSAADISGRPDPNNLTPAEREAADVRESQLGAPDARSTERDSIAARDARRGTQPGDRDPAGEERERQLLNGSVSAENRLQAQAAGSEASVRVGDDAPSPAEQQYGVAAYRDVASTVERGAGTEGFRNLFGGTGAETQSTTTRPANDGTPTSAANDDTLSDEESGSGLEQPQTPGVGGAIPEATDDATTTVTAQRNQFADANNDQRQSALNAYEASQQLRTQQVGGITV